MKLLYDAVFIVLAVLLQTVFSGVLYFPLPILLCSLLVISMRRGSVNAVVLALFCGAVTDFICGREFATDCISYPLAAAAGSFLLPSEPMRFLMGDYVFPGAAAVLTAGVFSVITPLFFGESWYYLAGNFCDTVLAAATAPGVLALLVISNDRIARRLELPGLFVRSIKIAIRPAGR
ncbi:MAG: hypothetical protein J6S24_04050 [Lentisphaeria bacterium]|nr:hypothetical protein [Lentisphaeria bacterium]